MLEGLLGRGYFPKELPPAFSTASFGSYAATPSAAVEKGSDVTKLVKHNLVRSGAVRRVLGIPHPRLYSRLCRSIAQNWTELERATKSSLALSRPTNSKSGYPSRAIRGARSFEDLPLARARVRSRARYVLMADVSNFYSSIYTHSIPWALHTKEVAKRTRRGGTGNELDEFVRNAQDGQTMGIPVGPDASFVIGELLLAQVDKALKRPFGFRYFDDYELGFADQSAAEEALSALEHALDGLELALNPRKTRTSPLPLPLEPEWTSTLRHIRLRSDGIGQATDLMYYFDRMSEFALRAPDEGIISYGIGTLVGQEIDSGNWPLFSYLLMQAAHAEPGVLRLVLQTLLRYQELGYTIPRSDVRRLLDSTVRRHSPLGHGSEVAWALWGALSLRLPLSKAAAAAVSRMDDSVVALLALDASRQKLLPDLDVSHWAQHFTEAGLHDEHWLLAYEATAHGWASNAHVLKADTFAALLKSGIRFYTEVTPAEALSAAKAAPTSTTRGYS